MVQKVAQNLAQIEQLRPVSHHGEHIDAERAFQWRELVQLVHDKFRNHGLLEIEHNTNALAVGFVAQVAYTLDLAIV